MKERKDTRIMRTRAGLVAMVAMLLVVVVGCTILAVEQEITYRMVSLGSISVSIPTNLERSQEEPFGIGYEDFPEEILLSVYDSMSDEIGFLLAEMDMRRTQEFQDEPWEGWEAMEEMGVTKGMVAESQTLNIMRAGMGVLAPMRPVNRQLVVDNKEAWELWYRSQFLEEPVHYYFLVIFSDEYSWMILYSVKDDVWEKYEESWDEIRDSVELAPQA